MLVSKSNMCRFNSFSFSWLHERHVVRHLASRLGVACVGEASGALDRLLEETARFEHISTFQAKCGRATACGLVCGRCCSYSCEPELDVQDRACSISVRSDSARRIRDGTSTFDIKSSAPELEAYGGRFSGIKRPMLEF